MHELWKKAIEHDGQNHVGRNLKLSKTTMSLIVNGKYPESAVLKHERKLFEKYGFLLEQKVMCPILGETHEAVCRRYKAADDAKQSVGQKNFLRVKDICPRCLIGEKMKEKK